jgi:hypothetical protein
MSQGMDWVICSLQLVKRALPLTPLPTLPMWNNIIYITYTTYINYINDNVSRLLVDLHQVEKSTSQPQSRRFVPRKETLSQH